MMSISGKEAAGAAQTLQLSIKYPKLGLLDPSFEVRMKIVNREKKRGLNWVSHLI
jgi:hypothetical protein